MSIALIEIFGAGQVGGTAAWLFTAAGHEVTPSLAVTAIGALGQIKTRARTLAARCPIRAVR